ncbi:MAG: polysaccharide biosynthesis C-terminal domain-containing protein [bacterium]|nr:polysaccharide biosynthesis C-terminal domain-containing protein [bacterium]
MEKRSHVKELFSQTVIYGLGIILNKSVGFILLPVYTKFFSPEQIGLFTLIQSLSLFFGVIYMFGMETSFMKFFIDAKDTRSKSEIYSVTLMTLSMTSLIFSIIIFFNAQNIAELFRFSELKESIFLIKILSVMMFVDSLSRFPLLLFRAELRSRTYAVINFLTFVVNVFCNVLFIVILRMGIEAIFYSYIISVTVTFTAGLFITKKYLIPGFSTTKLKELLKFGNKFIYIGFFVLLIDISDRFFLKYFFDESVVGIYSANYRLASVMGFMIASFKFSWTPYFLNMSSNPDNKKIISTIFTYFVFAGLLLFLVLSVFISQAVKIRVFGFEFLNVSYWEGLSVVPIVLLAYFFSGVYSMLNAAPFFTNKTISILIITFTGLAVNVMFNLILIPAYNITGAAMATLLTYFCMFLIIYFYSQKIYRIKYDWGRILKLVVLTLITFLICYFLLRKFISDSVVIVAVQLILIGIYLLCIHTFKIIDLKKITMLWSKNEKAVTE